MAWLGLFAPEVYRLNAFYDSIFFWPEVLRSTDLFAGCQKNIQKRDTERKMGSLLTLPDYHVKETALLGDGGIWYQKSSLQKHMLYYKPQK